MQSQAATTGEARGARTGPASAEWKAAAVWPLVLVLGLLVAGAIAKLPEFLLPVGTDTGMYATYGRLLLGRGQPYVAYWDLHPPLAHYYWALVQAVAGTDWTVACSPQLVRIAPPPSCVAVAAHALDLGLTVATALVVYAIGLQLGLARWAATGAALLTVVFANEAMLSIEGSNPAKLMLLPSAVGVWAYLRSGESKSPWWLAIAGASVSVAVLAKQEALLVLVALAVYALFESRQRGGLWRIPWGQWLALAGGAGVVLGAVSAYFGAIGSLGAFLDQAWFYNLQRLFNGYWVDQARLRGPERGIQHLFRESAGLIMLGGGIGALAVAARPIARDARLLLFWAVADTLNLIAFREFVQFVPSFALLTAIAVNRLWNAASRDGLGLGHPHTGRLALVLLFGSVFVLSSGTQTGVTLRAWNDRGPQGWLVNEEVIATYLRKEVPPGPLFVWGNSAQLYPLSGRTPASIFLNTEALGSYSPGFEEARAHLMQELERTQPEVIVTDRDSNTYAINLARFQALDDLLSRCYERADPAQNLREAWGVYVRDHSRPGC